MFYLQRIVRSIQRGSSTATQSLMIVEHYICFFMAQRDETQTAKIHQPQYALSDVLWPHCWLWSVLSFSEVGNTSLFCVLGDCLSMAATQQRPKDVLDKMDELWDEDRANSVGSARRTRHAIQLVLYDFRICCIFKKLYSQEHFVTWYMISCIY